MHRKRTLYAEGTRNHRSHFGFWILDFGFGRAQIRIPKSEIQNLSRAGSTLTEVLVALMIMSIGLVSLAVLFPMSVLRTIKASQFTNATDTRFNAEAMLDVYPNLVRNPDYTVTATGLNFHAGENFVVDPLGYAIINRSNARLSQYFGNDPTLAAPNGPGQATLPPATTGVAPNLNSWWFRRYSAAPAGQALTEAQADRLVTLPDSWVVNYEGLGTTNAAVPAIGVSQLNVQGLGATGFTLTPTSAAQAAIGVAAPAVRAVMFSADGVTSHVRYLTQITNDTIFWSENAVGIDLNGNGTLEDFPLPFSFIAGTATAGTAIGKVRIETQERRYTWLLTVRKNATGSQGDCDVVVFFKRPVEDIVTDETVYPATFIQGNTQVTVTYPTANKPFMRKGNYVFEANNAFWYRIANVSAPTAGANNTESVTITIDVPANANNTADPTGRPPRAMFPRAVVDVYPIGTKG